MKGFNFKEQFDFQNLDNKFWNSNKLVKEVADSNNFEDLNDELKKDVVMVATFGRFGKKPFSKEDALKAVNSFIVACYLVDGVKQGEIEMNKKGFKVSKKGLKEFEKMGGGR